MTDGSGRLIVISAPSGAGKGTVIKRLLQLRPHLDYSVSVTTRRPRAGETEGVSYFFVTHEQFADMVDNNELFEYAQYIGEYYGTPKKRIDECTSNGRDILLEIEVQGARQVMKLVPDALTIFIIPPSMEELERRLRGRGTDSEEKLSARLERARLELDEKVYYSHIIVNDEINKAAEEIIRIIDKNVFEKGGPENVIPIIGESA